MGSLRSNDACLLCPLLQKKLPFDQFPRESSPFLVAIPLLAPVVLMFGIMPAIINFTGVEPGGRQEMFSLPFQMTARYVSDYPDDITPEEYSVIDKVLGIDTLADRYVPVFADPVKEYYQKGTDEDYLSYIKVFVMQGLRHPDSYIEGFTAMISGWFSAYSYTPLMHMDWHNQLNPTLIPESVTERTVSAHASEVYRNAYYEAHTRLSLNLSPLLFLMSNGFYASFIPFFTFLAALRNSKKHKVKYALMFLPIILSIFLGCWLAPASNHHEGTRYLVPVVYCMPLMLMISIAAMKKSPPKVQTDAQEELADIQLAGS